MLMVPLTSSLQITIHNYYVFIKHKNNKVIFIVLITPFIMMTMNTMNTMNINFVRNNTYP